MLRAQVEHWLEREQWSPRQISHALATTFPDQPRDAVSHETIYQSLYVQGRGALRRDWPPACARAGRCAGHGGPQHSGAGKLKNMVNISDRPAEAPTGRCPGIGKGT